MARPQTKSQDDASPSAQGLLIDAPPTFTGPRVPVAKLTVVDRIRAHLDRHDPKHRLVRDGDDWVVVDLSQGQPADIEALGRSLGVMDQCEAMV